MRFRPRQVTAVSLHMSVLHRIHRCDIRMCEAHANWCTYNTSKNELPCNEALVPAAEAQDEVKSGLLLDIVVGKCPAVFQLFACEDKALLIWWNTFLVPH